MKRNEREVLMSAVRLVSAILQKHIHAPYDGPIVKIVLMGRPFTNSSLQK